MRLLLIEDDLKIASFVLKGFREAGFVVHHAREGETGLHMALHEPYDAAIIDIMLPKTGRPDPHPSIAARKDQYACHHPECQKIGG